MNKLIQRTYQAASGEEVTATDEAIAAVSAALGDCDDWQYLLEPVVVAWGGELRDITVRLNASAARRRIDFEIELEEGDVVTGTIPASSRRQRREKTAGRARKVELVCRIGVTLPIGYHELRVSTAAGESSALILAAPKRCYSGDRPREWGVFAPVYGLRSRKTQMIGDFGDLEALMRWVGEKDGDIVGILPISASFAQDPSPYSPASRLYWNEIYLRTREPLLQRKASELVDYDKAYAIKREQIDLVAYGFFASGLQRSKQYRDFLKLYPDARDYATFRAKKEGGGKDEIQYHLFAQFAAHQQLTSLAEKARDAGVRLYLDMPLGVHPEGYDVWKFPHLFITGASAGAPPDPFFTKGQNWGFPPVHPLRMREDRYRYWRRVLQTQLRYAGILRLDHVMSLHRLYVVPNGADATDGAYVRYPADELYAVLAIESVRHEAVIVGEDLGTVPPEVRSAMETHGVKRMYVVQFEASDNEEKPLSDIPQPAVASINTHDMPPFKAYWEAHDAELREQLGLITKEEVQHAKEARKRATRAIAGMLGTKPTAPHALRATLRHLAESSADFVLLSLEDLWLEEHPQNVPGTSTEMPNWRRRLRYTLDEIRNDPDVNSTIDMVARARRGGGDR